MKREEMTGTAWDQYFNMTPSQHRDWKQKICSTCLYFAREINSGSWGQGACDYMMMMGHGRLCCPLECEEKGVYVKATRKARAAFRLDWIKRHEGPGGRRIEEPSIKPVKPEEKKARIAAAAKAEREKRKAAGKCVRCGTHTPQPGKQCCEACLAQARIRDRQRHSRPETPIEPDVSLAQALPDLTGDAPSTPKRKPKTPPPLASSRRTPCGVCAAGSR